MTLKISVGLSKKVGQPNYGSFGASCQIEMEIDAQTCQGRPLHLQTKISEAFGICKASIENELALELCWLTQTHAQTHSQTRRSPESADMGLSTQAATIGGVVVPVASAVEAGGEVGAATGVAVVSGIAAAIRNATRAQVRALERIASQAGVDLTSFTQREFGVRSADQLTIRQASTTIDRLKALRAIPSR